jgi:hypothetical protein
MNQWEVVVAEVVTVETTGALLLADDGVVLGASLLDAWVRWKKRQQFACSAISGG